MPTREILVPLLFDDGQPVPESLLAQTFTEIDFATASASEVATATGSASEPATAGGQQYSAAEDDVDAGKHQLELAWCQLAGPFGEIGLVQCHDLGHVGDRLLRQPSGPL